MNPERSQNPLLPLWQQAFPFQYWDNRLTKVSKYNSEDRLEALYVLLQLSDLYAHQFSARVRNPDQPWFLIKEKTPIWTIGDTLKKLEEDSKHGPTVYTELLAEEPDGLIGFSELEEGWNISLREWIAIDILGCPVQFYPDEKEVEFLEEPEIHFAGANMTLNFWRENRELLNDFKHGFRLIPFGTSELNLMLDHGLPENDEAVHQLYEKLEMAEVGDEWELYFARMSTEEADEEVEYDYEVEVDLHKVDVGACVDASWLALRQLVNLFGRGTPIGIEGSFADVLRRADEEEPDVIQIIEHVASVGVVYNPEE